MFEKEAEEKGVEYADKQKRTISIHEDSGYSWGQVEEGYENGFKDGAEFGYKKGKEEVKAPYPSYKHLFGESIEQTALRYSNDLINSLRVTVDYAKAVIQDLLDNSDEYARQRAIDFLKE